MTPILIDQQSDLDNILDELSKNPAIFLDTEFIREQTYFPIACLLQIYTKGDTAYLIDLTSEQIDCTPLLDILKCPDIVKVFHSGRQDMEIFYHDFGFLPAPFFDTQIAASFLGYGEQISFDSLVKEKLDIQIDKSQQRTNWHKRPLNHKQMLYAAGDVFYLAPIYDALMAELEHTGRQSWVKSEMEKLLSPDIYEIDTKNILKKVKHRISDKLSLRILTTLALWREQQAIAQNRVRSRILTDEILVALSEAKPRTIEAFRKIRKVSDKVVEHFAEKLIPIIIQTMDNDDQDICHEKPERLAPHLEKLHNLLLLYTKQAAEDLHLSQRLLASSTDITHYLQGKPTAFLEDWRYPIYGQIIEDIVKGKVSIKYSNEKIVIT